MFLGEYQHTIDAKNRMALPAKFRNDLKGGAIITRGIDQCLFVFEKKEWIKLSEKLTSLPMTQSNSRAFVRLMMSGGADVDFDRQGRVLIPDYLKSYAKLDKDAVVIGLMNRIEVWEKKTWEAYRDKTEKQSEAIAEKLYELGI